MDMTEALEWAADFAKANDLLDYNEEGKKFSPKARLDILKEIAESIYTPQGLIEENQIKPILERAVSRARLSLESAQETALMSTLKTEIDEHLARVNRG